MPRLKLRCFLAMFRSALQKKKMPCCSVLHIVDCRAFPVLSSPSTAAPRRSVIIEEAADCKVSSAGPGLPFPHHRRQRSRISADPRAARLPRRRHERAVPCLERRPWRRPRRRRRGLRSGAVGGGDPVAATGRPSRADSAAAGRFFPGLRPFVCGLFDPPDRSLRITGSGPRPPVTGEEEADSHRCTVATPRWMS